MRLYAIFAVVCLMAVGQVLFKLAATRVGRFGFDLDTVLRLALNPYMIAGIIIYGITTVLWVWVLVEGSLSRSYPFVALPMVLVPLAGVIFFGEPITIQLVLGGAVLLIGLAIISYS